MDEAHERAAAVLCCKPSEIVFNSGGTESVNTAIFGAARLLKAKGRHIITSSIEHHSVLHPCQYLAEHEGFEVTCLPVTSEGCISVESLKHAIRPETVLVSIMAANNEIGSLQPIEALGVLCWEKGILFHTDAVQWFGKEPFTSIHQFNADLVSLCAHKIHGPKGAAALFVRSPLHLKPLLLGGAHENERRAGTENLASIVGLTEALERFVRQPVFSTETLRPLSERLIRLVDGLEGSQFVGSRSRRLANTVAFVTRGADSIALLAGLDIEGVCASSGSACSAGSLEPSHVIQALGLEGPLANSLVRFSLGRETSPADIEYVERVLPEVIERARSHRGAR